MTMFSERLDSALRNRGKSQTWLAEQLGVTDQAVSKWKASGKISRENLVKACRLLNVDPLWLVAEDDLLANSEVRQPVAEYFHRARVPIVGKAQLGDGGYWAELDFPTGHGDGYVSIDSADPNAYAVECRGESMRPRIKSGEYVVVEPNHALQAGDEVLVKDRAGRVMVKEWLFTRDESVHLISANEAHGKIIISVADIEVMHYVVAVVKAALFRPE